MKNKLLLVLLVFLTAALSCSAQKAVDDIRKRYGEIKRMISLMGEGPNWQDNAIDADSPGGWPPEYFHVKIVQNLPGTGYHEENVRMYYEEDGKEDEIYPPLILAFASSKYNFAAREFYEEYLYDTKGKLIFIYAQSPDVDFGKIYELRFYLSGGKVINTIVKKRDFNEELFQEVYSGKDIPNLYKEYFDQYIAGAKKIEKMFKAINDGRNL